jgi:hypothetical protein
LTSYTPTNLAAKATAAAPAAQPMQVVMTPLAVGAGPNPTAGRGGAASASSTDEPTAPTPAQTAAAVFPTIGPSAQAVAAASSSDDDDGGGSPDASAAVVAASSGSDAGPASLTPPALPSRRATVGHGTPTHEIPTAAIAVGLALVVGGAGVMLWRRYGR